MWIGAPIFGFLFVAAEPVIVLALGKQWRAAAPVFQILAIFALGQLLLESTLWLLVSRGQSRRLLKLLLIDFAHHGRQLCDRVCHSASRGWRCPAPLFCLVFSLGY